MKVRDLVELLQLAPQDAEVVLFDEDCLGVERTTRAVGVSVRQGQYGVGVYAADWDVPESLKREVERERVDGPLEPAILIY